ncbi:MAG: toxin-antitoxin system YwqK family antitoxin [Bacteroidetes bacterium]|nr:toxin-antitoxin system YwqK family antitoxin [Bacteroidota bacterium]
MKKLVVIVLSVLITGVTNAQIQNEKGLYIDTNSDPQLFSGKLFNGVISEVKNGVKTDFTVKEGVIDGEATYYYASGNKMETGTFKNGQKDQKWTRYNENGTISAIAFYNAGKKTGTWLVYDETGKKRFEMNYNNGEKTGVWTNWDESGAVASTKTYNPN